IRDLIVTGVQTCALPIWDPKPGTDMGGPFRAIRTSVPGVQICELLPYVAQQMHRLAIVRSINTAEDDHGRGHYMMETGRREDPRSEERRVGKECRSRRAQ